MRTSNFGRLLGPCLAVAMLAGCGANTGTSSAPAVVVSPSAAALRGPRPHGWLSPAVKKNKDLIYVANGNEVLVFPEKRSSSPIGSITAGVSGAYGLFVDGVGNLYVANQYGNTVTAYARGSAIPFATYSKQLDRPLYPVVDGEGRLFVSNANSGAVVEYKPDSTNVSQILQTDGNETDGMDLDSHGSLYVAYRDGEYGGIERFAPGATKGRNLGMVLDQPQGLIVTNSGIILAVETGGAKRIDEFLPGSTTPELEVPVPEIPVQLAITASERYLFVSTLYYALYVTPYPLTPPQLTLELSAGSQGVALSNGQFF